MACWYHSSNFLLIFYLILDHIKQTVNSAIFDAARASKRLGFYAVMDKRVKTFKPSALAQLFARNHAMWTHHDSPNFLSISHSLLDHIKQNVNFASSTQHEPRRDPASMPS